MDSSATQGVSRRRLLKTAAAAGVAAAGIGANILVPGRARAATTLRMMRPQAPFRAFERWFDAFARDWGQRHDTAILVDRLEATHLFAAKGLLLQGKADYDLMLFIEPSGPFELYATDLADVYQECTRRHGKALDFAVKSTDNPHTHSTFGFCPSFAPDVMHYRRDLWDAVGMAPDSWEHIRQGGAKIKKKTGVPVGIGLGGNADPGHSLRSILYSFGASVQDEHGQVVLESKEALEALKFFKALYDGAMTSAVEWWTPYSNNRAMLDGRASLVFNPINVARAAEMQHLPIADKIALAGPPAGPVRAVAEGSWMNLYVAPKIGKNIDRVKQFLVDYTNQSAKSFETSEFFNFPSFPGAVPGLKAALAHDERANPPDKYAMLADTPRWAVNTGYPGYANVAAREVFSDFLLNEMFREVAEGVQSPQDALKAADDRCKRSYSKWRSKGLV